MPISFAPRYEVRVPCRSVTYSLSDIQWTYQQIVDHRKGLEVGAACDALYRAEAILSDICHQMESLAKQGGAGEVSSNGS